MKTPLKILSLFLALLLAGAAFARTFRFVFFDTLRGQPSFEARVVTKAWWDPKDGFANAGFTKEGKSTDKPQLWLMVQQTNGALLELIWENAGTQHQAFSRSLQLSNTYRFPDVWDEFVTPKNKK